MKGRILMEKRIQKNRTDSVQLTKPEALNLLASTLPVLQLISYPGNIFDYRTVAHNEINPNIKGFIAKHNGYEYGIHMFDIVPSSDESRKRFGRLIEFVCTYNGEIVHDLLFTMNGNLIAINENPANSHFSRQTITSKNGYVYVDDFTIIKGDPLC